ncbi:MAG: hypothetical protein V1767_01065 [Chloroflexota bacterium]
MVTEHCSNPGCNASRKVYGSWDAIIKAGKIGNRVPIRTFFPHLDHDSINDIMAEIKGGKTMIRQEAIPAPGLPGIVASPPVATSAMPLPILAEKRKGRRR